MTVEAFHENQHKLCNLYPQHYNLKTIEDRLSEVTKKRAEVNEKFPYGIFVNGNWVEYDVTNRWCWERFGPKDGSCGEYSSEYPACPLVTETKYMEERPPHISEEDWEEEWHYGHRNPGEHSHEGIWTCIHLVKSGYDCGYGEYRFANEGDRDALALVIESLGMGEKYKD